MKTQPKKNGINKLTLLLLGSLTSNALASLPLFINFSFDLIEPTLSIYPFPIQSGQANSNFYFNVSPYLSVTQPEVDYRVTNLMPVTFFDLTALQLPPGVKRIYNGEGVCAERFSLNSNQSCILRFVVDVNQYLPSLHESPVICGDFVATWCPKPVLGNQLQDAIAHRLPGPTQVSVTPSWQDGLGFDPASSSITGTPTRSGIYVFSVSANNGRSMAEPRDLLIEVGVNPRYRPVFKNTYNIASAMPEQNYRLNMLELIEPTPGLMVNNQVSFNIDTSKEYPSWLSMKGGTILQGHVPIEEAGQQRKVTIIASSNTGGQSEPLTITISVAYDPAKKPVLDKNIKLFGGAGEVFRSDLRMNVFDPVSDSDLKIVLDKIEPPAPWLKVSTYEQTELEGVIPEESVGMEYKLTLHANNGIGGNSDAVIIPLKVAINKDLTPHFYAANPQLPLVYEGQSFFYDFVENNDISPEYHSIPYQVELADGYKNPSWLRIENNKIIADKVPENLNQVERLYITIKNIPGGKSQVIALKLFVMN